MQKAARISQITAYCVLTGTRLPALALLMENVSGPIRLLEAVRKLGAKTPPSGFEITVAPQKEIRLQKHLISYPLGIDMAWRRMPSIAPGD